MRANELFEKQAEKIKQLRKVLFKIAYSDVIRTAEELEKIAQQAIEEDI